MKLILIDGNAIIHRAFHAIPPFRTTKGELVNAVYGFAAMLLNILNKEQPDYIAVAFDLRGPTFRHKEYTEYKATRMKAPDELYAQIPRIHDVVKAFQIPIYTREGFEADDVLGTLAKQGDEKNLQTFIVTGDLDTLQLVTEKTKILANTQKFSEPIIYDIAKVMGRYGLQPSQIVDMKGLQGDNSDNLKGVPGIGPKTAKTLLQKYGTLENIYKNLDEITGVNRLPGGVHDRLAAHKDDAFQSKHLATIITDVPDITLDLAACKTHDYDEATLRGIFEELEFKSLAHRLATFHKHATKSRSESKDEQIEQSENYKPSEKKAVADNLQESLF